MLSEMYTGLQTKYSSHILTKLEFSRVPESEQMSNFMKILAVGAELSYAVGRTDRQTYREADRHGEDNSGLSQFGERA